MLAKKKWYYIKMGHQRGPVSVNEMIDLIESDGIHLQEAKVWKNGMKEWLPIEKVRCFRKAVKRLSPKMDFSADELEICEEKAKEFDQHVRGVGRVLFNLYFYVGLILVYFVAVIALKELEVYNLLKAKTVSESPWVQYVPYVVLGLVSLWVVSLRTPKNYRIRKNLGLSGVLMLCLFIGVVTGSWVLSKEGEILEPKALNKEVIEKYSSLTDLPGRIEKVRQRRIESKLAADEEVEEDETFLGWNTETKRGKRDANLREMVDDASN